MSGRTTAAKRRCILTSIEQTDLRLNDLTVLTEIGTNDFVLTPLIARMAGATRVICWTRDTSFGSALATAKEFHKSAAELGLTDGFEIRLNARPVEDIQDADVITNLGMLRPLDAAFLQNVSADRSVISLMYDAWELREADIDIQACQSLGVRVCGVHEADPEFPIFAYVGPLAAKMAFAAGYEIMGNDIVVWSDDAFGTVIASYFERMGASSVSLTSTQHVLRERLPKADFIFFADYDETRPILGTSVQDDGILDLCEVRSLAPTVGFVHLYGQIDPKVVLDAGHAIHPETVGAPSRMTFTLAEVGPVPFIRLMTAGLRAAQEVICQEPPRFAQPIV